MQFVLKSLAKAVSTAKELGIELGDDWKNLNIPWRFDIEVQEDNTSHSTEQFNIEKEIDEALSFRVRIMI